MKADDDPDVLQLASRMAEGKGVVEWPEGIPFNGACALVMITREDSGTWFSYAPDHNCTDPARLRISAARVLLDVLDRGEPDEGWHGFSDNSGWCTWLSTPSEAALRSNSVIPVSELPPLD